MARIARSRFRIRFDISDAKEGLRRFKDGTNRALDAGVKKAAETLLEDCRPYVPMLTGSLRDSGHIEALEDLAYKLVWDVVSPGGFCYAKRQYEEVFQHVDGRYAAKWIEKTLQNNPERYTRIVAQYYEFELGRMLNRTSDTGEV